MNLHHNHVALFAALSAMVLGSLIGVGLGLRYGGSSAQEPAVVITTTADDFSDVVAITQTNPTPAEINEPDASTDEQTEEPGQSQDEQPAETGDSPAVAVPVQPAPSAPIARGNPFAGQTLYAGGHSQARDSANAIRADNPDGAAKLDQIASTAQSIWIGQGTNMPYINSLISEAQSLGQLPVITVYGIRTMPCTGLPASATGYLDWVQNFRNSIGGQRVILIIEPDELPIINCSGGDNERLGILARAVDILASAPNATLYIDAGHSSWTSVSEMATRLKTVGIDQVQGFSLNVSNYRSDSELINYGNQLSAATGGAHYVIDSSRNGAGPSPDGEWCNAPGRKLGQSPGTASGLLDAYLWIKRPGESDGSCNGGTPEGQFYTDYAINLAS